MEIKTDVEFLRCRRPSEVHTESTAEYVLPDYDPDVRKILSTSAELRPSGRFVGDGEIEFSGIIVYNLVYSDSENNISSVSFSSDYDYTVKCNAEKYADSFAETKVSSYAVRLLGPRKVSASAAVVGSVRICESDSLSYSGSAFSGEENPEVKLGEVKMRSCHGSGTAEREYAESIARLEGAISEEVKVIHIAAEPTCDECTSEDGRVLMRGHIRLSCGIKNCDEPAYLVEKIIPLEEYIPFDGVSADMYLLPKITVTSLRANVNADDSGCEVVASLIIEMSAVGEKNQEIPLITDAYMRKCEVENVYENFAYTELCSVLRDKSAHTAEALRSEIDCEAIREVVFLTATPRLESMTFEDGEVKMVGEMRYHGVASEIGDDGKVLYVPIKISRNFERNVNVSCQNSDGLRFESRICATGAACSMDAEKLYLSSTIEADIVILRDGVKTRLSSCEAISETEVKNDGARVVVYYPERGESLFSVAKRYHTTVEKLARDNALEVSVATLGDAELSAVKRLIIY